MRRKSKFFLPIIIISLLSFLFVLFSFPNICFADKWINGYWRSDGTWVRGHYRTEPNYYKWDNFSWDGDWSDSLNDKSWYRDFGYDPEPWDDEIPNYDYWNNNYNYNYNRNYDWDYNYNYNWNYNRDYDYNWGW